MRIRHVDVDPALILAPMEGVTDLTFRRLIRQIGGCGLTITEFVPASGLGRNLEKIRQLVQFDSDERPVAVQLYGRDPATMADGARKVQDLGATILDLNMGCPSKRVCQHAGGSALMKDPDLARAIVVAMRNAVSIPFTVKMRSGWDGDHKNAPELAYICQEEGADGIAVHWRTKEDKYSGERELDTIAEVKRRLSVPVVANGDIIDVKTALDTLEYTKCDGLMIGRGAIRDPWVFAKINAAQKGLPPVVVDLQERKRVLIGYFDAILGRFRSAKGALGRFKKIAKYFTEGLPDGAGLRTAIFHSQTVDQAKAHVEIFFGKHLEESH